LKAALTADAVAAWYAHLFAEPVKPRVDRFELPGFHALNFMLHNVLDGGVSSSLRADTLGKGIGQQLLEFPIPVSSRIAAMAEEGSRSIEAAEPHVCLA